MNHWLETSKENLIPLSVATDFSAALKEWQFTGCVYECQLGEETCELCEHPELSNHYEIINQKNRNRLLVGSSCILKFNDIQVVDALGRDVNDTEERKNVLESALRAKLKEIMLEPLRSLWLKDKSQREKVKLLAQTLKNGRGVSPNELLYLISRMQLHSIAHEAKRYKISMRSYVEKQEIVNMSQKNYLQVSLALSKAQQASAAKLRGRRS